MSIDPEAGRKGIPESEAAETQVELETDRAKQIADAKRLLEQGPEAYNEILNKYALSKKGDMPTATGAAG